MAIVPNGVEKLPKITIA